MIVVLAISFVIVKLNIFRNEDITRLTNDFDKKNLVTFDSWLAGQDVQSAIERKNDEENAEATIFVVGDIMLSREVDRQMKAVNDYDYPFLKMKDLIAGADLAFGNLESPIVAGSAVKKNSNVFRADPEVAKSLSWAGFDVLNLANNHLFDQGEKGVLKTMDYLKQESIGYVGVGVNPVELENQLIVRDKNDIKIGFLGFSAGLNSFPLGTDKVGEAILLRDYLERSILQAKGKVDILLVYMHFGDEYSRTISRGQKEFAHLAIDAGADIVVGSHPHVVQEVEKYNNKYIFYSLGNFVFDQVRSDAREGLAIQLTVGKKEVKNIDYYPIVIENYSQPRLATEEEKERIIKNLKLEIRK